jgi:hypothetical protein
MVVMYGYKTTADSSYLQSLPNQPNCPSLAIKMQKQVTAGVAPRYVKVVVPLPAQPHLRNHESPMKGASAKADLWTFVTQRFAVVFPRPTGASWCSKSTCGVPSRGGDVRPFKEVLGVVDFDFDWRRVSPNPTAVAQSRQSFPYPGSCSPGC